MLRSLLFVAIALVLMMLTSTIVGMVSHHQRKRRLAALAAERTGVDSLANFQADFPDWPQDRLRRVYDDILILVGMPSFPLLPGDKLLDTLDIDQGNLDDFIEAELRRAGLSQAEIDRKMKPEQPVQTVRDMLNYIATETRIEEPAHGPR